MTTASINDSTVACGIIGAVSDHEHILTCAEYDSSYIYYYVLENAHAILLIDTKRRREIVDETLAFNTIVMVNKTEHRSKREIMDMVIRRMFGYPINDKLRFKCIL